MPPQKVSDKSAKALEASRNEVRYPIPRASVLAWEEVKKPQTRVGLNPGLIFDRFVQDWSWREQRFQDREAKKKAWQEIVAIAPRADSKLLDQWNARWEACAQAANAEPFPLKTDWPFVAGLGRKGALEVGFTFHRYGFPVLPGSSVKGIARAWALIEIARKVNPASFKELDDILSADADRDGEERRKYEVWKIQQTEEVQGLTNDFRAVFGTTTVAGRAVFFDAVPARVPRLELDVMNPHFPKYYQGSEPPTDWQSPVPVYFLTVAPGTEFRFAVGWRGPLDDEGRRLRDLAKAWLVGGLTELGAGAKTNAGYGYFVSPPQPAPSADVAPQPVQTAQPVQPPSASAPAAPTQARPTPSMPPAEFVWRTGTVREYQPGPGRGRLVDDKTGEELRFDREAIEARDWSPGKKHKVRYAVAQREGQTVVVKVQKA